MNSKEELTILINANLGDKKSKKLLSSQYGVIVSQLFNYLEVLEILKKKGVAVGFIQLQIKENCGGFIEYNDYIGEDKSLHLTTDEYEKIKEWLENE